MVLESIRVERLEKLETAQQLRRDGHDGAPVVELAAVVGCTEDGHQDAVAKELVAVFHNHVCSANQVKVVFHQKVHNDFLVETVTDASFVRVPFLFHIRWIGPEKVV